MNERLLRFDFKRSRAAVAAKRDRVNIPFPVQLSANN